MATRYLDFGGGIAVASLGYSHPHLVAALTEQGGQALALVQPVPDPRRRTPRRDGWRRRPSPILSSSPIPAPRPTRPRSRWRASASRSAAIRERYRILTFEGAFHGRTLATIAAGGQAKYIEGFGPKVDGFDQIPITDLAAVEAAIGPGTGAIMIEPIQGEGGVRVVRARVPARPARASATNMGCVLIFDEIQTGVGRTGRLFAYELAGVTPDIMTIAKGIGGGFPIGACLATADAAKGMTAGTHGTTFGGNPLAMAIGNAVLDVVLEPGFVERVARLGLLLTQSLAELKDRHPGIIEEIRGEGLMVGVKLKVPNTEFAAAARAERLLTIPAGDNIVRLLPPLILSEEELAEGVRRLDAACRRVEGEIAAVREGAAE